VEYRDKKKGKTGDSMLVRFKNPLRYLKMRGSKGKGVRQQSSAKPYNIE